MYVCFLIALILKSWQVSQLYKIIVVFWTGQIPMQKQHIKFDTLYCKQTKFLSFMSDFIDDLCGSLQNCPITQHVPQNINILLCHNAWSFGPLPNSVLRHVSTSPVTHTGCSTKLLSRLCQYILPNSVRREVSISPVTHTGCGTK